MSLTHRLLRTPTLQDVAFAVAWLLSVVLLLPTQLASMILFDSTGLDVPTPDLAFMAVVPALALALLPTFAAHHIYTRRITFATGAVAFATFVLVAAYTMHFFGTCGPGC